MTLDIFAKWLGYTVMMMSAVFVLVNILVILNVLLQDKIARIYNGWKLLSEFINWHKNHRKEAE